jgi:tetratricopeptide (TPR) repeat protein
MLITTFAAAAALALGPARPAVEPAALVAVAVTPAVAVLQQDPADSLYRAAREAMTTGDFRRAAEGFGRLSERFPKSAYASDARYFRALSLYRIGGTADLRAARESLRALRAADARRLQDDVAELDTRICGELAKRGDARCAAAVSDLASSIDAAVAAAGTVASTAVSAAAEALSSREVQTALAEARVASGAVVAEGVRVGVDAARQAAMALEDASAALASTRSRRGQTQDCGDDDDDERVIALNAMMQMDAEQAMPILRKVMARRDRCSELLRRRAVFLISQKRSADAADILIEAARNDPDREVREQAVHYIARIPGEKSLNFLRDIATRPGDKEVRQRAVYALSTLKLPEARAALRQVAASSGADTEVRADAIYRLGTSGSPEEIAFLRDLYGRLDSRELKDRVLYAVSRQRGSEEWLLGIAMNTSEPIELRKQALYHAGNRKELPAEQLFALYDRVTDREMKEQLIYVYSRRSESAAVDRMISIARNEKDKELRKTAVYWLSRSKDPRATAYIMELVEK